MLVITTYPPRECGIAAYTQDLIHSIRKGFGKSFDISICALESQPEEYQYNSKIKYILNTDEVASYRQLATAINNDENISLVLLQHEFGLFGQNGQNLIKMLQHIKKPDFIQYFQIQMTRLKSRFKTLLPLLHL